MVESHQNEERTKHAEYQRDRASEYADQLRKKLRVAVGALKRICDRGSPCLNCDLGYESERCDCYENIAKTNAAIIRGKEVLEQIGEEA